MPLSPSNDQPSCEYGLQHGLPMPPRQCAADADAPHAQFRQSATDNPPVIST